MGHCREKRLRMSPCVRRVWGWSLFVPRLDHSRPPITHHHTAEAEAAIMGLPADRLGARRFSSLGPAQGLGGEPPAHARARLTDAMWDLEGDADAEGDGKAERRPPAGRAASPTLDKGRDGDTVRPKSKSGKWGFLKKMSMERIRPETSGRPSTSQGVPLVCSLHTSPQNAAVPRVVGMLGDPVANGSSPSPTGRPRRQPSRDLLISPPSSTPTSHPARAALDAPSSSSSSLVPGLRRD